MQPNDERHGDYGEHDERLKHDAVAMSGYESTGHESMPEHDEFGCHGAVSSDDATKQHDLQLTSLR